MASDDDEEDSPVETLVIVRASLMLALILSLHDDELDTFVFDPELGEELDDDDELEVAGRDGLELELLSLSLLLGSFGERDGLEKVGDADFSCVMLGLPKLVCFGDMLECFGLPVEGLGLLLSLGDDEDDDDD